MMQGKQFKSNPAEVKIGQVKEGKLKKWHKPKLEDVSGKVMAQPYIRFT